MKSGMLSIIIPTLNEEKYLPRLLGSLILQNVKYEIIVADNNSSDSTRKIARFFKCRVVKGGSPSIGRNNGAKVAKGSLLLFLDADLFFPSNFVLRCVEEFRKRHLDIASCYLSFYHKKYIDRFLLSFVNTGLFFYQLGNPHGTGSFILVKKRLFDRLNGFKDMFQREDHDLIQRASKIGKFGMLNKTIFFCSRRMKRDGRMEMIKKTLKSNFLHKEDFDYDYGKY